jgi:cardiolipin synthase
MDLTKSIPNLLGLLRIACAPAFLFSVSNCHRFLSALIVAFAGVSDFLDGYLARRFNSESKLGEMLDPLADKIFCNFAAYGLCVHHFEACPIYLWLMMGLMLVRDLLLILGSAYARIVKINTEIRPVYVSKICTSLIFLLFILSLVFGIDNQFITLIGWVCISLIMLSAVIYITRFRRSR